MHRAALARNISRAVIVRRGPAELPRLLNTGEGYENWAEWLLREAKILVGIGVTTFAAVNAWHFMKVRGQDSATQQMVASAEAFSRSGDPIRASEVLENAVRTAKRSGAPSEVVHGLHIAAGDHWASMLRGELRAVLPTARGVPPRPICAEQALRQYRGAQAALAPTGMTTPRGKAYLCNAQRRVIALDRMGQVQQEMEKRKVASRHYLYGIMLAVNALNPDADVKQSALEDDAEGSSATTEGLTLVMPEHILAWAFHASTPPDAASMDAGEREARHELFAALAGILHNAAVNFLEMRAQALGRAALERALEAAANSEGKVLVGQVATLRELLEDIASGRFPAPGQDTREVDFHG